VDGESDRLRVMELLRARADFEALDVPALINALLADGAAIEVLYVHGHWRGVNDLAEFRDAVDFAHGHAADGAAGAGYGRDDD
jgi:phosphoenolpyruvate phosphomutase